MTKASSPLVSVIVPVYNVENYLDKCINSILSQTYHHLEIILVDDGSTDHSGQLCDSYQKRDPRIKVIHRKNGGLSAARNSGIELATGDYYTFIDSDDYIADSYVATLVKLAQSTGAELSAVKQFVVYPNRTIDTSSGALYTVSPQVALEKTLYGEDFDVSAWGKLYHKNIFQDIRFPEGQLFEDSATTYKLIDRCQKITLKSVPLYYYLMRSDSITNRNFSPKKFDLIKSTKAMTDYVSQKYSSLQPACNRRLLYAYLSTLTQLTKVKHPPKSYLNRLFPYIKAHRRSVLKDPRTPHRDRFALYLTYLGFPGFRFAWNCYSLITRRK